MRSSVSHIAQPFRRPLVIFCLGFLLCGLCGSLISCRISVPEITKKKNLGVIYDTSYRPPAEGQPPLLKYLDDLHARYQLTLAEPVAVTRWSEQASTWKIFFATNRGPESTAADQPQRFGKAVQTTVTYGETHTVLPGRSRGGDPARSSPSKTPLPLLPASWKKTDPEAVLARLEQCCATSAETFLAGITEQIECSTGHDLLVFVHGFNVDFESAVIRTAQIGLDLPFNGALCCYCWPSQGGIRQYGADEKVNRQSVAPFTQFLQTLVKGVPAETKIHLVVHSMGNRMVLQALNQLPAQFRPDSPSGKPFEHVVLCAPDVGVSDYHQWIGGVQKQANQVSLYACDGDTALMASKALHSEQRIGDADPPVIVPGVQTIDASPVELGLMEHSYYGGNQEVLCDLFCLLKENQLAEQRPWLKQETHDGQTFWRFHQQPPPVLYTWNFPQEILVSSPLTKPIQTVSETKPASVSTPTKPTPTQPESRTTSRSGWRSLFK